MTFDHRLEISYKANSRDKIYQFAAFFRIRYRCREVSARVAIAHTEVKDGQTCLQPRTSPFVVSGGRCAPRSRFTFSIRVDRVYVVKVGLANRTVSRVPGQIALNQRRDGLERSGAPDLRSRSKRGEVICRQRPIVSSRAKASRRWRHAPPITFRPVEVKTRRELRPRQRQRTDARRKR